MFTKTKIACAVLAVAASAFSVESFAVIQYTPWQSATTGTRQTGNSGDINLSFSQYDPAVWGAPLHNVEISLTANGYATYEYEDISGNTNNFQFIGDITVNVANPVAVGNLVVTIPNLTDIPRSVGPNGLFQYAGFPNPLLGLTGTDSDGPIEYSGLSLTPALAAYFTGAGSVNLLAEGDIAFNFNGNNDASNTVLSRWDGEVQVRYSYDVPSNVPEPVSLSLIGVGLAGLGFARRRKAA